MGYLQRVDECIQVVGVCYMFFGVVILLREFSGEDEFIECVPVDTGHHLGVEGEFCVGRLEVCFVRVTAVTF